MVIKKEKMYKIGEIAELLGVHSDTLRNWEKEGFITPERIGARKDRRYTSEHIRIIKEKELVSNLAKRQKIKDYSSYSPEELIKELQTFKKQKKLGLVWEKKVEDVVELCKKQAPIIGPVSKMNVGGDSGRPNHILIEGDNYHALQVLNYTHAGKIDVIYIDPPYNTGATDWKYNNDYVDEEDSYRHSKWISMMNNRLKLAKNLLTKNGVLVCAIDENERPRLELLLEEIFPKPKHRIAAVTIVHNPQGVQGKNFSYTHEYALFVFPDIAGVVKNVEVEERKEALRDDTGNSYLRTDAKNCFYPVFVKNKKIIGFGEVPPDTFHPKERVVKKNECIEIWPIRDGVERKWRYARQSVEGIEKDLFIKETRRGIDVFQVKKIGKPKTVWVDPKYHAGGKYGTKLLKEIIGEASFKYPKSLYTVLDVLKIVSNKDDIILDFFAGSGTTGHATLELNKEDGGNRKFILCTNNEFGEEDEKLIKNKYNVTQEDIKKEEEKNSSKYAKWQKEYGIASSVTQPRIKKVIEGYKMHSDGGVVKGLGGNLKYLKTDFVDTENVNNINDNKRLEFTHEAGYVIALKEDTFIEKEKNEWYQIFTDGEDKFVGIYFRENIKKLEDLEKKILNKKEVKLYIFSHGEGEWKNDYVEYENVSIEDIPDSILKVYKKLNINSDL